MWNFVLHSCECPTKIGADEFRLLTLESGDVDYWTLLMTPFQPFTNTAWLYIILLVLYMSIALLIMEAEEIDPQETTLLDHITDWVGVENGSHPWLAQVDKVLSFVMKSVFNGMVSFTSGAPVQDPTSFPGRVIYAGFAGFGLIILTAYTASSAAALVADASGASISSLDDVIAMGDTARVCVRSAMEDSFSQRYPTVNVLGSDLVPDMIANLDDGKCVAAVIMKDAWDRQLVADSANCKKKRKHTAI